MARPKRLRRLTFAPPVIFFSLLTKEHRSVPADVVVLTLDKFEAIRLADLECYSQDHGAREMDISRATFGRIVESGKSKVAHALVQGCRIEIAGGALILSIDIIPIHSFGIPGRSKRNLISILARRV